MKLQGLSVRFAASRVPRELTYVLRGFCNSLTPFGFAGMHLMIILPPPVVLNAAPPSYTYIYIYMYIIYII